MLKYKLHKSKSCLKTSLDVGFIFEGKLSKLNPPLSLGFNEATRCLKWGKGQQELICIGSMHVEKGIRYPK
jgi:hypothetical protein